MSVKVGVVGAGFMGSSIAGEFARFGNNVVLYDTSSNMFDKSKISVNDNLQVLVDGGVISAQDKSSAISRISYEADMAAFAKDCKFIIEAVFEDLEVKRNVFKALFPLVPSDCVVSSNTSSLSITAISEAFGDKSRLLAVHFLHPAHLIPLVEVTPTPATSPAVIESTLSLLKAIGKSPVLLKKEVPGYLAARLQAALFREALYLVQEGVVSVEDCDKACKDGFGRRLTTVGPLEVADMAGLDIYAKTHQVMFPCLSSATDTKHLDDMLKEGKLGAKNLSGFYNWTDESFAAIKAKRDTELVRRLGMDKH
eukprot:TRINITY_DN5420_c0_g1_i1.p1 TRINITY_DN5420_c0_g1~~TRINITY_DN5420_c0_g1_i1.p1  ORF type:complete len:310 (-),score=100.89 TRINITY_DN5420_c0_g1_i1:31-960(-)